MLGFWLMHEGWFATYDAMSQGWTLDESHPSYEAFIQRVSRGVEGSELFMLGDEGVAHIPITGVLTKEPDFFFSLFGPGSSVYGDIIQAVQAADRSDDVERIVLEIDSPGGNVDGFFDAAAAIAGTSKPIEAQVTDLAASGAFGLASQADSIIVNNPMAMVGSVGVAASQFVSDSRVTITSTEAPNKRPDLSTDEGVAALRAELDAVHGEFASIIATGRGISVNDVNSDFGRGGMVIARAALQANMIDGIGSPSSATAPAAGIEASKDLDDMNLEELKSKHPELYASVCREARAEGVTAGIDQERDRVNAHVEAGKNCGNPEIAMEFIADGSDFSKQTVQAKYLTAARNAGDVSNRDDDEPENIDPDGQPGGDNPADTSDAVVAAAFDDVAAGFGVELTKGAE